MKNKIFFLFSFLLFSVQVSALFAEELKWNCGVLSLQFNEIPGAGTEYTAEGCWQDQTYYLISSDCHKNIQSCLNNGKGKEVIHPGKGIGSPAFVQCYRNGGKPRFLKVKINDKWENTSTCFFGSQKSFADFDSISAFIRSKEPGSVQK